ncbi:hypothetical protein [Actinacidiphila yeochonensis]|uniref:hypothetical protein n=1 Tax=Actinacidiphila yeochonensis TaxID=89050 RepID=UPI000565100B|nr:hypothetical protein [Actinacidiphila yeochonensis]
MTPKDVSPSFTPARSSIFARIAAAENRTATLRTPSSPSSPSSAAVPAAGAGPAAGGSGKSV